MIWHALLLPLFLPVLVFAQTNTEIRATVISSVSAAQSAVTTDLQQVPADGKATIMVFLTVVDANNNPLPAKDLTLSSNRATLDKIQCFLNDQLLLENKTTTDDRGEARCVIRSASPGKTTLTAVVDTVTLNDKPVLTFNALPVSGKTRVIVKTPQGKEIVLVEPKPAPSHNSSSEALDDPITTFELPFFAYVAAVAVGILMPILLLLLLYFVLRVRKIITAEQKLLVQEEQLLEKIAANEKRDEVESGEVSRN